MPRFYCDYCDAYLTHDSMSGRQQHMRGWKHRENFKLYYQTYFPQWAMETQMQQMQNPQYQMMVAAGYMPPYGGGAAPDGSFDLQAQQIQQMQQMQMQSQQMMGGQMPTAVGGVPPPMMPPVFRPPPSMAPPPASVS